VRVKGNDDAGKILVAGRAVPLLDESFVAFVNAIEVATETTEPTTDSGRFL